VIFFLDTDICIYVLRGKYPALADAFRSSKPERIKVPSMVAAELFLGAERSNSPLTSQKSVDSFLEPFEIVPFDAHAAEVYAQVRFTLGKKGEIIGPNDLVIASTVLSHRGTLVTHNVKEFSRVAGLILQDWTLK
jgi:tRNA(fMet)-specific endonuclease VapC